MPLTPRQLTGQLCNHIETLDPGVPLHPDAAAAFRQMQAAAATDGHQLVIASGFRSYQRQCTIWEQKLWTTRTSAAESWRPILRWSALPGASRHHWGTDFDWFDPSQLGTQTLQLEPWEYLAGGPFAGLSQWLDKHSADFGFYRPYQHDLGGVAPEPWHLSFAPLAKQLAAWLTPQLLQQQWQQQPFQQCEVVVTQLPTLLERYHGQVTPPPARALRAPGLHR